MYVYSHSWEKQETVSIAKHEKHLIIYKLMFEGVVHNSSDTWLYRSKSNVVLVSDDRLLIDNTQVECPLLAQCQCLHYIFNDPDSICGLEERAEIIYDMQYPREINNTVNVIWQRGAKLE